MFLNENQREMYKDCMFLNKNTDVYLKISKNKKIDEELVKLVEKTYNTKITDESVKCLISKKKASFYENYKVLSNSEIINANKDLKMDFIGKRILPLIDCSDNDFIVYNLNNKKWSMFNIVDGVSFKVRNSLNELL